MELEIVSLKLHGRLVAAVQVAPITCESLQLVAKQIGFLHPLFRTSTSAGWLHHRQWERYKLGKTNFVCTLSFASMLALSAIRLGMVLPRSDL